MTTIADRTRLKISPVDVLFSNGRYPIEFLFFYKDGFSTMRLRRALRKIASPFWPAFGEYRDGLISFDEYREDDFFAEEAVRGEFDVAEVKENPSEAYFRYQLPHLKKLFFLKVIRFENGLALIPKLSHLAGDGYSYFFLLARLAMATRPSPVPLKSFLARLFMNPRHRRTALKDFVFRGSDLAPVSPNEKFSVEFLEISREEVNVRIAEAASVDHVRISTNDVLSAMALKYLAGKQDKLGKETFRLTMPIDVRRSVKEYGPKFFGNGLMFHALEFKHERLDGASVQEVAVEIRRSMPAVSKESYANYLAALEETISRRKTDELKPFDPERGCLVTNLTKLPTGRLDFGTGRPGLIIPLSIEKNSAGLLAKDGNFILRFATLKPR